MTSEQRALLLQRRLSEVLGIDAPPNLALDVSACDETVTLSFADIEAVLAKIAEYERRYRKRDVLVAQIVLLMRTAELRHPVFDNSIEYQEQIANRLIDAMGVAVLVEGESPNTGVIASGDVEMMSREAFERRSMGGR
jgi:hypothetical protein